MKFVPTVNLWDPAISRLIQDGRLKLQRGQWVRCGLERRSRIVNISGSGLIWAVHPRTDKGRDSEQYQSWLTLVRGIREDRSPRIAK